MWFPSQGFQNKYLYIILHAIFLVIFLTINPDPSCQLSLWENPEKTLDILQSDDEPFRCVIKCPIPGFKLLTL